jgi:hypothetical protein
MMASVCRLDATSSGMKENGNKNNLDRIVLMQRDDEGYSSRKSKLKQPTTRLEASCLYRTFEITLVMAARDLCRRFQWRQVADARQDDEFRSSDPTRQLAPQDIFVFDFVGVTPE